MIKRSDKRAQLKMSFGMIFSIILIIIFIAFAIFAITKFLELNGNMKSAKFMKDLQTDIDNMWKSSKGSQKVSYYLPRNAEAICFEYQPENSEEKNFYIIPKNLGEKNINHINWTKTQGRLERKCFEPNTSNKVILLLEKDYGETTVTIRIFQENEPELL